MNDLFQTPHPSLLLFVQTIEAKARKQVQHLNDIRVERVVPHPLLATTINKVPHSPQRGLLPPIHSPHIFEKCVRTII